MSLCCWGGGVVGYSADVFVLLGWWCGRVQC